MLKPLDDRILQETFAEEDAKAFAELKKAIDKSTPPVELLDALLVFFFDLRTLVLDDFHALVFRREYRLVSLDVGEEVVPFGLQILARELRQAPQPHVEDFRGLDLGELEVLHQLGTRHVGVVALLDDLDHRIDILQCFQ